jgi:predicted dehydrogenase
MPRKSKVRGGIVGSGSAAHLHYEGLYRVHGTDAVLVGIFSPTPENAHRFAEPRGLTTFASLEPRPPCGWPATREPFGEL